MFCLICTEHRSRHLVNGSQIYLLHDVYWACRDLSLLLYIVTEGSGGRPLSICLIGWVEEFGRSFYKVVDILK